ncbi:uncharacterized protein LOC120120884 [Hibiscus syriacus]|uniref:uncharacterized protein LOC120120884 n=1 Tax=Hibiscus syriacus TaxID=106335 RepID=UPI001921C98A|nr:uncharacterized protein LOC120120884 [Hibiscus syriacus]
MQERLSDSDIFKPPIESEDAEDDLAILHLTHQHPLKPVDINLVDRFMVADSATVSFLHNTCMATIPPKANHFFCPYPLMLFTYMYVCAGCDDHKSLLSLMFGYERYHFRLDAKCALLPTLTSPGAYMIYNFNHRHPLKLSDSHNEDVTSSCCDVCRELRSDPAYI